MYVFKASSPRSGQPSSSLKFKLQGIWDEWAKKSLSQRARVQLKSFDIAATPGPCVLPCPTVLVLWQTLVVFILSRWKTSRKHRNCKINQKNLQKKRQKIFCKISEEMSKMMSEGTSHRTLKIGSRYAIKNVRRNVRRYISRYVRRYVVKNVNRDARNVRRYARKIGERNVRIQKEWYKKCQKKNVGKYARKNSVVTAWPQPRQGTTRRVFPFPLVFTRFYNCQNIGRAWCTNMMWWWGSLEVK